MNIDAIAPVSALGTAPSLYRLLPSAAGAPSAYGHAVTPFSQLIAHGVDGANQAALNADRIVHDFTLDDSMPVHQVTYALEQARLSLELLMQVRNRLLEGYQQMMNMQL